MAEFLLSAFADEAADSLTGQIDALDRNDLKYIEIRSVDGKNIIEHDVNSICEIKRRLDDSGIKVSAVGSPIGKIYADESFEPHKQLLLKAVETAHILGTDRIRIFSFYLPKGKQPEDVKDIVIYRMGEMLQIASDQGIKLCHENEKGIFGSTAENCLILHRTFDKLGGIFDPANYIQCGESPCEIIDKLLPFTTYMHIKDALLSDKSVVPAGLGDGNIPELIRKCSQKEGEFVLTLEPHLAVFNGFSKLETGMLKNRFQYSSQDEAFDTAASALKKILGWGSYKYE